ncbi:sugar kinase [Roseobacter sp. HKCCA0434]|uniref:sugar kinase n=1 Tax=Roseobacter sp. HKCCA0434 TaxID=3079297 RepID=UPI0029058F1E|nr:sugar kinase [Roseobacter sp. HKCCA0434]
MNTETIVAIGEAMVEFSRGDEGHWHQGFAGDTLNVAWAARALLHNGQAVGYVTRVGEDALSTRFLGMLDSVSIGTGWIGRDSERTMGLYTIETDAEGERSFSYWRGQSAARRMLAEPDRISEALARAGLVYFSGITLAILSPEDRTRLLDLLTRDGRGFRVAFDPNIRPRLWEKDDILRETIEAAARASDIVLPTFDDEAAAFGDGSPEETLDRYRGLGVGEVIVKDGVNPTRFCADATGEVPVRDPIRAIDTTGAGDSFNGAYLAGRLLGRSVQDAIGMGQAASRAVVATRGALLDMAALRRACA